VGVRRAWSFADVLGCDAAAGWRWLAGAACDAAGLANVFLRREVGVVMLRA
jgi:hypothetical protein